MPITRADLDPAEFISAAHYNMGRAGYGYGFTCVPYPRLSLIDRVYKPAMEHPDGKQTRTWYVDGAEVADLDAAVVALNVPPVLTPDEQRILDLVPHEFVDLRGLEDELAGVPHPDGAITPDTPHSRVLGWLHWLRAKGLVEYGKQPWAADYKPQMTIDHLRWSPTIRRIPSPQQERST